MREPARLEAAIEILDAVIAAARDDGPAADTIIARWFAAHRFAGSGDKAAIRELVWAAIRLAAERPPSGRAALLGLARHARPDLWPLFDGSTHAPGPPVPGEPEAAPGLVPPWLVPLFESRFGARWPDQAAALAGRAPLDLRVNALAAADAAALAAELGARPIPGLPHGLRLDRPVPLDRHPRILDGTLAVQDAGSQHVVRVAAPPPGGLVVDLCAGAGGKTLALAAAMEGRGRIIATDTDRRRLRAMAPRLAAAGAAAMVEARLLDPGREAARLADLAGAADLVLVDAPCSGTGTWRRNPELRWRLTPARLQRLVGVQARLRTLGASLLRPGGRLVYAVCSVLDAEGERGLSVPAGLRLADRQALTPLDDGCDGFFIATMVRA